MKKLLIHFLYGMGLTGLFIVNLIIFLIRIPKAFYLFITDENKRYLAMLPQFVREYINRFDHLGYKHNKEYLDRLPVVEILSWDILKQSNYCEEQTVVHLHCCLSLPSEKEFEIYYGLAQLNASAIGNLAYVALNHRNELIQKQAFNYLCLLKQKYNIPTE